MADESKPKTEAKKEPVDLSALVRQSPLNGEAQIRLSTHLHRIDGEKGLHKFLDRVSEIRKSDKINAITGKKDGKATFGERNLTELEAVQKALDELPT